MEGSQSLLDLDQAVPFPSWSIQSVILNERSQGEKIDMVLELVRAILKRRSIP